jgi:hypothetical protein
LKKAAYLVEIVVRVIDGVHMLQNAIHFSAWIRQLSVSEGVRNGIRKASRVRRITFSDGSQILVFRER